MADTPASPGAAAAAPVTPDASTPASAVEAKPTIPANEAFARKERQIRRMQEQLQRETQALEAKRKQYETDYVPKSRLKEDFWTVAQEAGLDYDQLTEQVLAQPSDPATKAIMAKMKAMEAQMSQQAQQVSEAQEASYKAALKQIDNEAKLLIDSDPEFETIKNMELHEEVTQRIESHYKETGLVRNTREVALEIENELIEDAIRFASLPKVQKRLMPQAADTPAAQAAPSATKPPLKQTQSPVTITNRMQADSGPKGSSEKDRIARALAAFKGNAS